MTVVAHLRSLYSAAPIILWVEDVITRDYLGKVWGDPSEVAFMIGGTASGIHATVHTAIREGISHVFGLVDRDFGTTNRPQWNDPQTRVFRLPRHEVENYSMDAHAVTGCLLNNRGRTLVQVQNEMDRLAGLQPHWLACRRVLRQLREVVLNGYPASPPVAVIAGRVG